MKNRALIDNAIDKAQAYSGDIIVSLCRAVSEENSDYRYEQLDSARANTARILKSIEDALAVEVLREKVA